MDAQRWQRLERHLESAFRRPPGERVRFLAEIRDDDSDLGRRLERLVAADEAAGSFLERPAAGIVENPAPTDAEPERFRDRRIGVYRLLRPLEQGGTSTVFLAEREDREFERQVAIKVLRGDAATAEARQRLLVERQILARLEHPHIARLYDGGTTADGQPYLVLEYIDGLPVDRYCARHGLPLDRRLELFLTICSAVHFAHQNLLVHRDLKPNNILVDGGGEPKLLDFGIAKNLGPGAGDFVATRAGWQPMTPAYASPEQILGGPVTTATDVYALGLLLYELVTGCHPFAVEASGRHPIERVIREVEPARPSDALSCCEEARWAGGRERLRPPGRLGDLRRRLRGDLDNIILKAMRKDPGERYASVEQLADDLRRQRSGLPVRARRPTFSYRLAKFLRRHRGAAAVAAALLVVLGIFAASQLRQAEQVARERDKACEALAFLVSVFEQADPYRRGAEEISARDVLEVGARRVASELDAEPEVQAALLDAIGRSALGLRQLDEAEPLLAGALALRRKIAPGSSELADSLERMAWLRFLASDYAAAEAHYREALELRTRVAGRDSPQVAATLNHLGMVLGEKNLGAGGARVGEVEALHREAIRILEAAGRPESPDVARALFYLSRLRMGRGDLAAAEDLSRENLRIMVLRHGENHPESAMSMRQLALILIQRARADEAQALLERALAAQRRTLPADHPDMLLTLNDLALAANRKGDLAAAEARYREVLDGYLAVYGEEHAHTAVVMSNLATTMLVRGRPAEAAVLHERALAVKRAVFGERHAFVVESLNALARAYSALGRHGEALERAQLALASSREIFGSGHPSFAQALSVVGLVHHRSGESAVAEPYLRQSVELFRETKPEGHFRTARVEILLGSCLTALGRLEEAEPLLTRGAESLAARYGAGHPYVRDARAELEVHRRARAGG